MREEIKKKISETNIKNGVGKWMIGRKLSKETKNKISKSNKGRKLSLETRKKLSSINFGRKLSKEHIEKLRSAKLGKFGRFANRWKGDAVGYGALHEWITKELGAPSVCEMCKINNLFNNSKIRKINWANKSRKYKRNINDWIRLCIKCHRLYDKKRVEEETLKTI